MRLLTMTPLHIGSGERLTPISYVTDKNILYVLDMNKFFSLLTEGQSEAYLQWMDPILNNLAEFDKGIDQAKKMRDHRKKGELQKQKRYEVEGLSIHRFIEKLLRQNPASFAQKCAAYTIPCSSLPRREGFKTHIKNCQNRAYIPGSEIKGALRTALLYKMLKNEQNYQILRNSLINFRSKKNIEKLKKIATAQDEYGLERCLLRGKEKDAKYDLFKFLRISDTQPAKADSIKIEVTHMLGTVRYTKTWIETIIPRTELSFDFSIEKNFSLDHLDLKEKENWFSPSSLLEASYHRTKDILQKEKTYFTGEKNILNVITMLEKENQPKSPLLRLGAGQGFLGTTLNLIVLKNDPQLYDEAIRDGVSFYRRWRTQKNNFPKTRRVIIDPRDNALTNLGWAKLIPDYLRENLIDVVLGAIEKFVEGGIENSTVDLKRSINFSSKSERAEFAKDIAAIANNHDAEKGYMIIGVLDQSQRGETEKDGEYVIGVKYSNQDKRECQMGQILHTYIEPPPSIKYSLITYPKFNKKIGVIEILPSQNRPHITIKESGKILQNIIYVRRGSGTFIANRQEVINLTRDFWKLIQEDLRETLSMKEKEIQNQDNIHYTMAHRACKKLYNILSPMKKLSKMRKTKILEDILVERPEYMARWGIDEF